MKSSSISAESAIRFNYDTNRFSSDPHHNRLTSKVRQTFAQYKVNSEYAISRAASLLRGKAFSKICQYDSVKKYQMSDVFIVRYLSQFKLLNHHTLQTTEI